MICLQSKIILNVITTDGECVRSWAHRETLATQLAYASRSYLRFDISFKVR